MIKQQAIEQLGLKHLIIRFRKKVFTFFLFCLQFLEGQMNSDEKSLGARLESYINSIFFLVLQHDQATGY